MKVLSLKDEYKYAFGRTWKKRWRKHVRDTYKLNGEILDFFLYSELVGDFTESVVHLVDGYDKDKRGFVGYHIDHKISRSYGYRNGIDPRDIAHVSNLRFVCHESNTSKGIANIIDEFNKWII